MTISDFFHFEQMSQLQNAKKAVGAREANAKVEWMYPKQVDWNAVLGQTSVPGGGAEWAIEGVDEEASGSAPTATMGNLAMAWLK